MQRNYNIIDFKEIVMMRKPMYENQGIPNVDIDNEVFGLQSAHI